MALDPAVLKARIDLRVCQLKELAVWTALNWRGHAERKQPPRDPPPARRNEDDERTSRSLPLSRFFPGYLYRPALN